MLDSFHGLQKQGQFTRAIKDWFCYLPADRAFVLISWNRLEKEVKKDIFLNQCFHLILIVIAYIPY